MNKEKIITEVTHAETNLLSLLRNGDLLKGVAVHMNTPGYRNIWNGEIKTYEMLVSRIKEGIDKGLMSFDYQVREREFMIVNS